MTVKLVNSKGTVRASKDVEEVTDAVGQRMIATGNLRRFLGDELRWVMRPAALRSLLLHRAKEIKMSEKDIPAGPYSMAGFPIEVAP